MNIEYFKNLWNKEADEFNQWDQLDCNEKCEWIIESYELTRKELEKYIGSLEEQLITLEERD